MRILDPGHTYALRNLDGLSEDEIQLVRFVKRIGEKFPGNQPPAYSGTTVQEVLRACVDRLAYVDHQERDQDTFAARKLLITAVWHLEKRAARRHGRTAPKERDALYGPVCPKCGHVGCEGKCHP